MPQLSACWEGPCQAIPGALITLYCIPVGAPVGKLYWVTGELLITIRALPLNVT